MTTTFDIHGTNEAARTGVLETRKGAIRTPAFMPVGTAGTVKAMYTDQVRETGADILLGNTYHLMLRPGAERVASQGGLHKFMRWPYPILTDSGGYQVMSLSQLRQMSEEGVAFQSHIDGSKHMLSPERSMEIQHLLGSDIVMVLDECTPHPASYDEAKASMELSMRWAERSKVHHEALADHGALFGIVQGSVYANLRQASVRRLEEMGFEGYAVGGLAVGEGQEIMFKVLDETVPHMMMNAPRYLMGVGKPADIVGAVARGIDMFDCVLPTRSGRTGQAFTKYGPVNIRNARHADDPRPLDEASDCPASRDYSRAYLHHLVKSGEILGSMLMTWHNLTYYQSLMSSIRTAIAAGRFADFQAQFNEDQARGDIPAR